MLIEKSFENIEKFSLNFSHFVPSDFKFKRKPWQPKNVIVTILGTLIISGRRRIP